MGEERPISWPTRRALYETLKPYVDAQADQQDLADLFGPDFLAKTAAILDVDLVTVCNLCEVILENRKLNRQALAQSAVNIFPGFS